MGVSETESGEFVKIIDDVGTRCGESRHTIDLVLGVCASGQVSCSGSEAGRTSREKCDWIPGRYSDICARPTIPESPGIRLSAT